MKFKTTQKEIKASYPRIIKVGYCTLQTLLDCKSPVAYTERREGWAADIYDVGGGVAIVTGYSPFGNIIPAYNISREYEIKAEKIRYDYSLSWDEMRDGLEALIKEFCEVVISE